MIPSKIQNTLFSFVSAVYWLLHPQKSPKIAWKYNSVWSVYDLKSRKTYYVPSKSQVGRGNRQKHAEKFERYTMKDFVEIEVGDTVIDVGAFIGEFSIPAQEIGATVHAIEPAPVSFHCLTRNTESIDSIKCYQTGIWNENTTMTFSIGEDQTENSLFDVDNGKLVSKEVIDTQTIDSFLNENDIKTVNFLKVEAEGAEPEVLEGAITAGIKKIAVDAGAERYGKETADTVSDILVEADYEVRISGPIVFGRK